MAMDVTSASSAYTDVAAKYDGYKLSEDTASWIKAASANGTQQNRRGV